MQKLRMNSTGLAVIFLVVGTAIVILEVLVAGAQNASLLLTLVFWVALAEGCIALVAAAELSHAQWILPIKRALLSVYPIILFISILFLFLGFKLDIYPWAAKQNAWLNKPFFLIRNFILLLLAFLFAWKFAVESGKESEKKNRYAVLYILFFVFSQSLVAFDWVMTLEYPWFSTLFGGFFFVESFYSGIALAGILCVWLLKQSTEDSDKLEKTLKDTATLMFGFALFWVGLFFAQYLVIWYGNIPEETSFLVTRLSDPVLGKLSPLVLIALFVAPFTLLLPQRSKSRSGLVQAMSMLIIAGIFLERLIFLIPVVSLNPFLVILEFLGLALLFAAVIANRHWLIRQS